MEEAHLLIENIENHLKKGDLQGVKEIVGKLSWQEKTDFTHYCRKNNLCYCDYWSAIELIEKANFEGFIKSIYGFEQSNFEGVNHVVEARIDLSSKLLYWNLIMRKMSENEAFEICLLQELRLRVDLMSHNKYWQNLTSIEKCWSIIDTIANHRPEEDLFKSLVDFTISFLAEDRDGWKMRNLAPSRALTDAIIHRNCLNILPSKEQRILKKWRKIRASM